jgi:hypothetical protein
MAFKTYIVMDVSEERRAKASQYQLLDEEYKRINGHWPQGHTVLYGMVAQYVSREEAEEAIKRLLKDREEWYRIDEMLWE